MTSDDLLNIAGVTAFVGVVSLFGFLIVRDTIRQRGMWGLPHKKAICGQCGTAMPMHFRIPTSWRQAMWGGWTCAECGFELDKFGRPTKEQNTLAKWAVLQAVEEGEENRHRSESADERIREANDQTQRGDVS